MLVEDIDANFSRDFYPKSLRDLRATTDRSFRTDNFGVDGFESASFRNSSANTSRISVTISGHRPRQCTPTPSRRSRSSTTSKLEASFRQADLRMYERANRFEESERDVAENVGLGSASGGYDPGSIMAGTGFAMVRGLMKGLEEAKRSVAVASKSSNPYQPSWSNIGSGYDGRIFENLFEGDVNVENLLGFLPTGNEKFQAGKGDVWSPNTIAQREVARMGIRALFV